MIKNRLEKNLKKLQNWSQKYQIEAFRLYDRDIPEFPFIVDKYKDYLIVYDKSEAIDKEKNHGPELIQALKDLFQATEDKIILKVRRVQERDDKYTKLEEKSLKIVVKENGIPFYVNLTDYLDTGLFLDHRPTRYTFKKMCKDHQFLNLFCYTGTASVMAALAGAKTTSVDLSPHYLQWAKDNFDLNKIPLHEHKFTEADVLEFMEHAPDWPDMAQKFHTIFLDPPTFSNSKKMRTHFDVQKDQNFLIHQSMKLLKPNGTLFFSCNKRDFKMNPELELEFKIKNTSKDTIPIDFHDQKIHRSFEITRK